jgi:Fe-S-cluster containining protein
MLTDPAEVARLAREKEAENVAFRRWLHTHHADGPRLRVITASVAEHSGCRRCAACCRATRVEIDDDELARLAAYIKLRPAEVLRLYCEARPGEPALLGQADGACVFLDHGECLVYPARPRTCRDFPYLTGTAGSLGARMESLCRKAHFCPLVYDTLEELKVRLGYPG